MVALITFLLGSIAIATLYRRIVRLEREVTVLRAIVAPRAAPEPPPAEEARQPTIRTAARVTGVAAPAQLRSPESSVPPEQPASTPAPSRPALTFETLVGGKLPIWVGGVALILAGFFLVRLSIESGWLGPGVRTAFAAAFAALLVAASEAARRHGLTRDDPRIGQALAGAGVASAYGTLYIAATQYHLVGALFAFVLMIAVTAAALFLALRHGPPTAVMALIGGFVAPLVAGYDAAGVEPLLAYLALFIAALFALAARRGWRWLAIAAVVAGFGWANLLLALAGPDDLGGVAAFVVVLAIGATLALPRTGESRGWLRVAPLVAGSVQLLALAPQLDFGAVAWIFHLVLAAAAIVLARRDVTLLPGALAAAVVVAVLLAVAYGAGDPGGATLVATIVAAALFGGAGSLFSRRDPRWATIALIGIVVPLLIAQANALERLPAYVRTILDIAAAAAAAALAWRHRDRPGTRDVGLVGGSLAAAALAVIALGTVAGDRWLPLGLALAMPLLAWWAARVRDAQVALLPALLLAVAVLLAWPEWIALATATALTLAGETLNYPLLPDLSDVLRAITPPAVATLALMRRADSFGAVRRWAAAAAAGMLAVTAFVAAKQVLAIADPARFVALGFGERAAITLAFLAIGWALARYTRFVVSGQALAAFAVARFAMLDLSLFNPLWVAQSAGVVAIVLPGALAAAAATLAPRRPWRIVMMAATTVAVAAAVRTIAHGEILTGPVGNGETWGYSAALLLLAILWLWRGVRVAARDLRLAGLALLTLVTLKVFLIDVAALGGVLRILSFLGLGVALIGIGWGYGRVMRERSVPATG